MSGQHTQGPWSLEHRGNGPVVMAAGSVVARTYCTEETSRKTYNEQFAEQAANAERIVKCVNSHDELMAYAKCEEARTRGEDIAETVLKLHGFNPSEGTSHEFMDRMRRAAIAKATGGAAT